MSASNQSFQGQYNLANLTAPASGTTHAAKFTVATTGAGTVQVNMSAYMEFLGDFQGQACTVDNTKNASSVTIQELTYGWQRVIPAGTSQTFQYPSVQSQVFNFIASAAATITFSVYDWPAFPDWGSVNAASGGGGSVTIVSPIGQTTKSASVSVTLASDQGALAVDAPSSTPADAATFTVATGGTAVTVFAANSIPHGAVIKNPNAATEPLEIDIVNAAQTSEPGTNGTTVSLLPGQSFFISAPLTTAVSANAATSGHTFVAWSY